MLFATLHKCGSLREVTTGMQAQGKRLLHLGIRNTPRRSTLAEANQRRDSEVFGKLYHELTILYKTGLPDSRRNRRKKKLFIIDSTLFTLFLNVMKSVGVTGMNGRRKGGAKAHVMMDAEWNSPVFVWLTEGKVSDKKFLQFVDIPPNSMVVLDKGYNFYNVFSAWTKKNIIWYTRITNRAVYVVTKERPVPKKQLNLGVSRDCLIMLGNPETKKKTPLQKARLVFYFDKETNKKFEFLTNDFTRTAFQIAEIYKRRWQIELFFKRIKQNFPLKYFLGDNENAIKTQIWCSLIADLLVKVIMDRANRKPKKRWAFSNICGFLRLHLGTYIDLMAFLANPEKALLNYKPPDNDTQLSLF